MCSLAEDYRVIATDVLDYTPRILKKYDRTAS